MYFHSNNLPFGIVRPSNAYGFGQKFNTGQGFVAQSIYSIINNEPITIFGKKGTVRDYIHVSDIAKGIVSLLKNSTNGQMYNLGTGIGKSNLDVIEILKPIASEYNKENNVIFKEERKFDVTSNILNCEKISNQNGWSPQIKFKEGIRHTFEQIYNAYHIEIENKF
jgi:UDP-glucose 4-epimerase